MKHRLTVLAMTCLAVAGGTVALYALAGALRRDAVADWGLLVGLVLVTPPLVWSFRSYR